MAMLAYAILKLKTPIGMMKFDDLKGKIMRPPASIFSITAVALVGAVLLWGAAGNRVTVPSPGPSALAAGLGLFLPQKGPQAFASNEFLVKVKGSSNGQIRTVTPGKTGVGSLDALGDKFHVQEFEKVLTGKAQGVKSLGALEARSQLDQWYVVKLPGKTTPLQVKDAKDLFRLSRTEDGKRLLGAMLAYQHDPNIEHTEPNLVAKVSAVPNDFYYGDGSMWGLTNSHAGAAWDVTTGLPSVVVAVSDTGVDYTNPELADHIWKNPGESGIDASGRDKSTNGVDDDNDGYIDDVRGWNFAYNTNDPADDMLHGTHVAGIIGASGNNDPDHMIDSGTRVVGMSWRPTIMPVKFLDGGGSGTVAAGAASVIYATDRGANIINMSWGGNGTSAILDDALRYAHERNVILVAAAGNSASDIYGFSPANSPYVITVGAVNSGQNPACFSNFGVKMDVDAPGGDASFCGGTDDTILSTLSSQISATQRENFKNVIVGNSYIRLRGTSMAAPHVAGLAALIKSVHPEFTNEQVRQVIRLNAEGFWHGRGGYGPINAAKAVSFAKIPPAAKIISPSGGGFVENSLAVSGYAYSPSGGSFEIFGGAGNDPSSWTRLLSGNATQNPGTLGTVNLRSISTIPQNQYQITLRLVVTTAEGVVAEDRVLVKNDTSVMDGWPRQVGNSVFGFTHLNNPVFADLDGDGTTEIIVVAQWDNLVHVFRADGSDMPGWPAALPDDTFFAGRPTVADLDGDGKKEVVVLTTGFSYDAMDIFHADGTPLPGWSYSSHNGFPCNSPGFQSPTPLDINGDGRKELIVQCFESFFAIDVVTKQVYWNVPLVNSNDLELGGPAVADLDGDGQEEIVTSSPTMVYVVKKDGTPMPGWPKLMPGGSNSHTSTPTLADINGDGKLDILVDEFRDNPGFTPTGYTHVFALDGSELPGWPRQSAVPFGNWGAGPVVADLDSNGTPEIIVKGGGVEVRDRTGEMVPGWNTFSFETGFSSFIESVSVGDFDGDGQLEILIPDASGPGVGGLKIYKRNKGVVWSRAYDFGTAPPVIGDIDGDKYLEIAGGMHNSRTFKQDFFLWKYTQTKTVPKRLYWPQFRFNEMHTGNFQLPARVGNGVDSDLDGFSDSMETRLGTNPFDGCGAPYDTTKPGSPSLAWPADLYSASSQSFRMVSLQDLASFIAPVRRLDTKPGDQYFDARWDINGDNAITRADMNLVALFINLGCQE